MAPWHDCAPSHSRPDGAVVAGSTHRATHRPRQLAPNRSARDTSCLPPIDPAPHGRPAAIIVPVWLPYAALIPIYWNLARPVRLPLPIIPGINDRDVSLRWIRVYPSVHRVLRVAPQRRQHHIMSRSKPHVWNHQVFAVPSRQAIRHPQPQRHRAVVIDGRHAQLATSRLIPAAQHEELVARAARHSSSHAS